MAEEIESWELDKIWRSKIADGSAPFTVVELHKKFQEAATQYEKSLALLREWAAFVGE